MRLPGIPIRATLRLRLTLLFGGLFFLGGAFLLVLTYTLIGQAQPPPERQFFVSSEDGGVSGVVVNPGLSGVPAPTPEERERQLGLLFQERERAREEWLSNIRTQSGMALVLTSVGALALGGIVAGRVLRPVRQITLYAKELSSATLDKRIALTGPNDELKELADTIDAMLTRLEAAFDSQRHFSAQASHELRTPLSIIRAEADVALASGSSADAAELASRVRAAVDLCDGLIDRLLALARSESTMRDHDLLDLAELTGDVVGEYASQANESNVRLDLKLDYAPVLGDRALLERLVANLVDNAIRYNEQGGWASIAVSKADSVANLEIENSGPRVRRDDVTRLLSPFHRGERSENLTPGYGLGLAIVRAVTLAHGGDVSVLPRAEGGLSIHVALAIAKDGEALHEEGPAARAVATHDTIFRPVPKLRRH